MIPHRFFLSLLALALCMPLSTALAESPVQAPTKEFTRLWTDENGVSHFSDDRLDFEIENYAPPAPPMGVYHLRNATPPTLVHITKGVFEDWHPAPRRQFMFILQGAVEVGVSDGEKRRFEPGSVVLLEDLTGKGHTTEAVGDEDHISVAVPVPE